MIDENTVALLSGLATIATAVAAGSLAILKLLRHWGSTEAGSKLPATTERLQARWAPRRVLNDPSLNELFANQAIILERCRGTLSREHPGSIAVVHGEPGSGKTWVLRKLAQSEMRSGRIVVMVRVDPQSTPLDFLVACQAAALSVGYSLPRFKHSFKEVSRSRLQAREVTASRTGSVTPLGTLASLPHSLNQELVTATFSQRDRELLFRPEIMLTTAMYADLERLARRRRTSIFVDGCESGSILEAWIVSFFSELPASVSVVMGRRDPAPPAWVMRRKITNLEVDSFDAEAIEDLLHRFARHMHQRDFQPQEVKLIQSVASPDPLSLAIAATLVLDGTASTSKTLAASIHATARMLLTRGADQNQRDSLETICVARWLDRDLFHLLVPDERLSYADFSTHPSCQMTPYGPSLHSAIRRPLYEDLFRTDPHRVAQVHVACARYFRESFSTLKSEAGLSHERTRAVALELCHHLIRSGEPTARSEVGNLIRTSLDSGHLPLADSLIDAASKELGGRDPLVGTWSGYVSYLRGDLLDAESTLSDITSAGGRGDELLAPANITLGRIRYARGDFNGAAEALSRALDAMTDRPNHNQSLRGYALEQRAKVARMMGQLSVASELHGQALSLCRAGGDSFSTASALGSYGTTLVMAGNLQEGTTRLSESISLCRDQLHGVFLHTGLRSRSMARTLSGDLSEAIDDAEESEQLASAMGDRLNTAVARSYFAEALLSRLSLDDALQKVDAAVVELERIGASSDLLNALACRGLVRALLNDSTGALKDLDSAGKIADASGFDYGSAWVELRKAQVYRRLQENGPALEAAERGLSHANSSGAMYLVARLRIEVSLQDPSQSGNSGSTSGYTDVELLDRVVHASQHVGSGAWLGSESQAQRLATETKATEQAWPLLHDEVCWTIAHFVARSGVPYDDFTSQWRTLFSPGDLKRLQAYWVA